MALLTTTYTDGLKPFPGFVSLDLSADTTTDTVAFFVWDCRTGKCERFYRPTLAEAHALYNAIVAEWEKNRKTNQKSTRKGSGETNSETNGETNDETNSEDASGAHGNGK